MSDFGPMGFLFNIVTVKVECLPDLYTLANGKKLVKNIFLFFSLIGGGGGGG